jgi:hypothetical protein
VEEFDIYIRGFLPARPGATVEGLRRIFGLDPRRAQEFVQSVPRVVKRRVSGKRAEQYERALKEIGAVYDLRPCPIRPAQIIAIAGGAVPEDDPESQRHGRTLNLPAPMLEPPSASVAPSAAPPAPFRVGEAPASCTVPSVPAPPPVGGSVSPPSLDSAFGSVRPPEPGFPSVAAPPMPDSVLPPGLVAASTVLVVPASPRVPAFDPSAGESPSTATLPEHAWPAKLRALSAPVTDRGVPPLAPGTTTDLDISARSVGREGAADPARTAPEYKRAAPSSRPPAAPAPVAFAAFEAPPEIPAAPPPPAVAPFEAPPVARAAPAPAASAPIASVVSGLANTPRAPGAPPPAAMSKVPSSVWAALEPADREPIVPATHAALATGAAVEGAPAPFASPEAGAPPRLGDFAGPDWLVEGDALRQHGAVLASPGTHGVPTGLSGGLSVERPATGVLGHARGRLPGAVAGPRAYAQLGDPDAVHELRRTTGVVAHSPGLRAERTARAGGAGAVPSGSAFEHVLSRGSAVSRAPMSASVFTRAARAASVADDEPLPLAFRIALRIVLGAAMFATLMGLRHCDVTGGDVQKTIAAWDQADFGSDRREPALDWMVHGNHMFVDPDKDRIESLVRRLMGLGAVQVYATDFARTGPTWISRALLVEMPEDREKRRAVLLAIQKHEQGVSGEDESGVPRTAPYDDGRRSVKISL